jgi:hypothetical protein
MRRKEIKATEIGNLRSADGSTQVEMKRIVETVINVRSTRHCKLLYTREEMTEQVGFQVTLWNYILQAVSLNLG